jgi:plasmid stabilization system protein ParE
MAAPTFRLTSQAQGDLNEIADYLRERSPTAAHRVLDALHRTFKTLAENPGIGAHREDLPPGLRMFVPSKPATKYIVFYTTIESGVLITDVIHSARDWVGMFDSGER